MATKISLGPPKSTLKRGVALIQSVTRVIQSLTHV
jgi:hypothetical protein